MQPSSAPPQAMPIHHALARALEEKPLLVVGFCAAWCNTCGEFSAAFDRLAASRRDAAFVWLDIEDDADVAGDIDIENFPTLAVFNRNRLLHFGTSLPQSPVVTRLLDSLDANSKTFDADESVTSLPERLIRMSPEAAKRALRQG
jgi:thioredoxin 1